MSLLVYGGGSAPQAGGAGGSSGGGGGSAGGGIGGGGSGGPSAGGSPAGQGNAVQIIYGQPAGGPANPPGGQYPAIPPTLPPAGTFSQLCSPAFIVDAAWNDYARGRIYFVSGSSVYAISNKDGQLVENGALLSTDFPNAPTSPAFAYYQAGLTTLVDKVRDMMRNICKERAWETVLELGPEMGRSLRTRSRPPCAHLIINAKRSDLNCNRV